MHDAKVTLKDGQVLVGPIWEWRPRDGWFSLAGFEDGPVEIQLANVAEAHEEERVGPGRVERVDLLERAKKDGWKDVHQG
jgi:hypothetical protein